MTRVQKQALAVALAAAVASLGATPVAGAAATKNPCADNPAACAAVPDPGTLPGTTHDATPCQMDPAACVANPDPATLPGADPQTTHDAVQPDLIPEDNEGDEGDEGLRPVQVTFKLSEPSTLTVSFDWQTVDGTYAKSGADFAPAGGHVSFAPGETKKTVTVDILGDTLFENGETFSVKPFNVKNAHLVVLKRLGVPYDGAAVGINDDDAAPAASVDDVTVDESAGVARFHISLSKAAGTWVWIDYATADGSATASADYQPAKSHYQFAPYETTKEISVPLVDDAVAERTETFAMRLSATPMDATIGRGEGTATVLDTDAVAGQAQVERGQALTRPDRPRVKVRRAGHLSMTALGGLRLPLTCPTHTGGCHGRVRLRVGTHTAGRASFSLEEGQSAAVTIALSGWVRHQLARHHRVQMLAVIVPRDPSGPVTKSTAVIDVRGHDAADELNPQPLPPRK